MIFEWYIWEKMAIIKFLFRLQENFDELQLRGTQEAKVS